MQNKINRVTMADSYKYSQSSQYPQNTTYMFDYMEARSNKFFNQMVSFGFQYMLKKYFSSPIEAWEVEEAAKMCEMHGEPFEYEGWMYIVNELDGKLPIKIRTVPEGMVIPVKNIFASIESTDPKVFWIVGWIETFFMKVWYPITVATKSYFVKQMIQGHLEKSGDPKNIGFKYHNFSDRGCTSVEAASIAGMAHLTQFDGTDNFNALRDAKIYYNDEMAGFSIKASEHSCVTSWGKDKRFDFYDNYLESSKALPIVACVMDSYDIYGDVSYITSGKFKEKVESDEYPIFVIRPDSGNPVEVMNALLNIMEDNSVKFHINEKGYKVFDKYAFIWGDGVTPEVIDEVYTYIEDRGYSADIMSFGSGGDLAQNINRDTLGMAIKCSAVITDGKMVEVYKDPITDPGKKSKKGILELYKIDGNFITSQRGDYDSKFEVMKDIFINGEVLIDEDFKTIKERS